MDPRILNLGPTLPESPQGQTGASEPGAFSAPEYILPLLISLAAQERPERQTELQRRFAAVTEPPRTLREMNDWLRNGGISLEASGLERALKNLATETYPRLFFQDLLGLARDYKSHGRVPQAYLLYQFLQNWSEQAPFQQVVGTAEREEIREELALITGQTEGISLSRRLGHHFEIMDQYVLAEDISLLGGNLGLATMVFSLFRPARPLAALGIKFLSNPVVSATLITAGGLQLYHQFPQAQAAFERFFGRGHGADGSRLQDGLFLGGYFLHGLSTLVGIGSFAAGAHRFCRYRTWAREQGYTPAHASRVGYIYGDAARRAFEDPLVWSHWGGAGVNTITWARPLARFGGLWTHRALLGGSLLVGGGNFYLGLSQDADRPGGIGFSDLMSRLAYLGLDVSPGVTMLLYRAGRGSRSFDLGPALSQELTEAHYTNPQLKARVLDRIENGLFPLSPAEERSFIQGGLRELADIRGQLERARRMDPLAFESTPSIGPRPDLAPEIPVSTGKVHYSPEALFPHWTASRISEEFAGMSLGQLREQYASGRVAPSGILQLIWRHEAIKNSSLFPRRLDQGVLGEQLRSWARQSDQRFQMGGPWVRPLEGVFIAVKDLFPGSDGVMMMGSKTSRMVGVGESPVVRRLRELGAIPLPVGMVAAANGGSGMHAGFGYIPHPTRPGFDPAGSSSGTAHVVGLQDFPVSIGIGTDTGGSVIAPAGAVGLQAWVPPRGFISTKNMVPFDTALDRVGVLSRHSDDAFNLARMLRQEVVDDPHLSPLQDFQPSRSSRPQVVYLENLVRQSSPEYAEAFHRQMQQLRDQGVEVRALGSEWDFLAEVPLKLYPLDAYGAAAFTFTNPMRARWGDPPRRTLDHNLQIRLAKGYLAIKYNLFDEARSLSQGYQGEVRRLLGEDWVLASPSPEAVPTQRLQDGSAGPLLDQHDRITMAKNRIPWWGQFHYAGTGEYFGGVSLSGPMHQVDRLVRHLEAEPRAPSSYPEPLLMAAQ